MKILVTSTEMKQIEDKIFRSGVTSEDLIEKAGTSIANFIEKNFSNLTKRSILILAGSGNNGLDGISAAKHLSSKVSRIEVWVISNSKRVRRNLGIIKKFKLNHLLISDIDQRIPSSIKEFDIIIDGIIGIGSKTPIKETTINLLDNLGHCIDKKKQTVISIDNPSNLNPDNGYLTSSHFQSDITLMIGYPKLGCHVPFYPEVVGKLKTLDIGLQSKDLKWKFPKRYLLDKKWAINTLPKRPLNSHKGTSGTTLIIGGSVNYPGAAFFAGSSATKTGVGLVGLMIPEKIYHILAKKIPDIIFFPSTESKNNISSMDFSRFNSIAIGPGLGTEKQTKAFTIEILDNLSETRFSQIQKILDADALNHISTLSVWWEKIPSGCILTPHFGEMSRLTKIPIKEIQKNKVEITQECSSRWNQIIVLKGSNTIISHPNGELRISPWANSGMAKGGTGDLLTGIISGLSAHTKLDPFEAASLGVYVHGLSGDLATKSEGVYGMTSTTVLEKIPEAFTKISIH